LTAVFTPKKCCPIWPQPTRCFFATNDYALLTVQTPFPARVKLAVDADMTRKYHADEAEKVLAHCKVPVLLVR
jgi:hypothetical protein